MPSIEHDILDYIAQHPGSRRSAIHHEAVPDSGETTIYRALKRLVAAGKLEVTGRGRATQYTITGPAAIIVHLQTPYFLRPLVPYKHEFLDAYVPCKTFYLSETDRQYLRKAGSPTGNPLPARNYAKHILEQLLVDLAWASSRMEGNSYDILETERLIKFGEVVDGKDRQDALMILNHKEAIQYVVDNLDTIKIAQPDLFNLHTLLSKGLLYDQAMSGSLRGMAMDLSYSNYKPLKDVIAIEEEFENILQKAAEINDPFEQSFFLLVHSPYLQGFIDVNKRTSRVASNIPLLKADLAPMSFLTIDDALYIDAIIGIYELNNVALLREVYIASYLASAEKYRVAACRG